MIGIGLVLGGWVVGKRFFLRKTPLPSMTVEVLNGTRQPRLAWKTTLWLRQQGVDVWFFGNAPEDTVRETLVIAVGDSGMRRAEALSQSLPCRPPVESVKDPLRMVDAVIILGENAAHCFPGVDTLSLVY